MKKIVQQKSLIIILLLIAFTACFAAQPLPPEQAFQLSANIAPNNVINLQWNLASGHYLYRDRFSFHVLQPKTAHLGMINFPQGEQRQDDILGKYEVYTNQLSISVSIINPGKDDVILEANYQGCSESGYCYPPITHRITANFVKNTVVLDIPTTTSAAAQPEQNKIKQILQSQRLLFIILGFLGFGVLLSFTPCVLPMIPILSGIILGHGHHISHWKAFRLSLVYVLSMSFTYAIAGILVGYIGGTLQAVMQKPWVIILFSLIYILMAVSMFGYFNLQPPQKMERFLAKVSAHQRKGHYLGVIIMGCLATLIISPCVTPALVAALGYIGQSGDEVLGGVALFATGFGMGLPLILVGTSTKLLPKAGHWMTTTKYFVGVLLLAMAIVILSRILPGPIILLLWAILLIGCAIFIGVLTDSKKSKWSNLGRVLGIFLLAYGVLLIIGAAMGHSDPLKPFARSEEITRVLPFQIIKSPDDMVHAFALSKSQNKPVLLDFYADWCISCKEMDREIFSDPKVQNEMRNFMLLRADVTKNDDIDKALMQQYGVIAPPTIIFFTPNGQELKNLRIVGETGPVGFLQTLQEVQKGKS